MLLARRLKIWFARPLEIMLGFAHAKVIIIMILFLQAVLVSAQTERHALVLTCAEATMGLVVGVVFVAAQLVFTGRHLLHPAVLY